MIKTRKVSMSMNWAMLFYYSSHTGSCFQLYKNSQTPPPVSWFLVVPPGSVHVPVATAAAAGAPDSGDGD